MKKLCTAGQMRQMDKTAMYGKYRIAPAVLMENAGHAVAEDAAAFVGGWNGKDVIIFCGTGNNGGDGFVIARHLLADGARVYVYILGSESSYSTEARSHLHTLQQMQNRENCMMENFSAEKEAIRLLAFRLHSCRVAVDAMLGTGFHGELRSAVAVIVQLMNTAAESSGLQIIAVDIPTGVNSDTGAVSGMKPEGGNAPLHADMTITFGALKRGQFFYPGRTCCGTIKLNTIGMPLPLLEDREADAAYVLEKEDVSHVLVPRSPASHKGTHGTIGIVTGSRDMSGAALMACRGAMRSGAGKIFLCVPEQAAAYCIGKQPEIIVKGIGSGSVFTRQDAEIILSDCSKWDVIAMGPGMGKDPGTKEFVKEMIARTSCPIILDADALNLLADEKEFIRPYGKRIVMTPHLAEFSHLSGMSLSDITSDIITAAKEFVHKWHVHIVVKGAPTVIVSADTLTAYVNPTGNAGMATGGMGDILTGMITAFAGHESMPDLCAAACCGVYIHGTAGDFCHANYGPYGFSPVEVADAVPRILADIENTVTAPGFTIPMITETAFHAET